jgi:hypothetical protein
VAQIAIAFDTATKKMVVTIDGKAVENVTEAQVYPSWDDPEEYRCMVMTRSADKDSGITTMTMLMAEETKAGKSGQASAFPGFTQVVTKPDSLKAAIEKFLLKAE